MVLLEQGWKANIGPHKPLVRHPPRTAIDGIAYCAASHARRDGSKKHKCHKLLNQREIHRNFLAFLANPSHPSD